MVHELFNVEEYEQKGLALVVRRLKSQGYFGMTISCAKSFPELLTVQDLDIEFYSGETLIGQESFKIRVFRPLLTVTKRPDAILLKEGVDLRKLIDISMRYQGLGTTQIEVRVVRAGDVVSYQDSLYDQLARRLIARNMFKEETETRAIPIGYPEGLWIDPNFLADWTKRFLDNLSHGRVPPMVDEKSFEEFREWLLRPGNTDRFMRVVYSEIEEILIGSLLNYLDRYPTENIELAGGTTKVVFKPRTKSITVIVQYKDSVGNVYEPIETPISVNDQRRNTDKAVEVPINIDFEIEPLSAEV